MKNFAFRRALLKFLIVLGLICAFEYWNTTSSSERSLKKYDRIVSSQPRRKRQEMMKKNRLIAKQTRKEVERNFWLTDAYLRRKMHLEAVQSELSLYGKKEETSLIESFIDLKGTFQQALYYELEDKTQVQKAKDGKVYKKVGDAFQEIPLENLSNLYPKQRFCYFEAKEGIYDFQENVLIAYDVTFWTYCENGHDVAKDPQKLNPLTKGKASSLSIQLTTFPDNTLFHAKDLKMNVITENGVW